MKRAAAVVLALLGAGCSLPLELAQRDAVQNVCEVTDDCGAGADCVNGACVATDVDLVGLLVEVRPNASSPFGATTSHLFDPAAARIPLRIEGNQPYFTRMDPVLPLPVAIRDGLVRVHKDTLLELEQGCSLRDDPTVPAHVTFHRVAPFVGINLDPIGANTGDDNRLDVDLVRGTYDVYIEPQPVPGCNGDKPFPPVFRLGLDIPKGATTLLLDLPIAGKMSGKITDVPPGGFEGWKVDVVEPTRGLPIAANAKLTEGDGVYLIDAQISWPEPETNVPILRLVPPAGMVQPTAYWKLFSIGGTPTNPIVNQAATGLFASPVKVSGNVLGPDGFTRVRASLSIQSKRLDGPNAENAAFAVDNVQTDANGVFSLLLPPGEFQFRAFPADGVLSVTDTSFPIQAGAACFCGQPFPLSRKIGVGGVVKTPGGARLGGATVSISSAQEKARDFWSGVHALPPKATQETPATTSDAGSFVLLADPGTFDVVVQAVPGSGFPWLVRPRVALSDGEQLGALSLSAPALLSGVVRDPNGAPVANAEINAWFPVRDDSRKSGLTGTVVKIATTSTDANGSYTLVLPSSVH